jgi:hypothetical protein
MISILLPPRSTPILGMDACAPCKSGGRDYRRSGKAACKCAP